MNDVGIRIGDVLEVHRYFDVYFKRGKRFVVRGILAREHWTEFVVCEESSPHEEDEITIQPEMLEYFRQIQYA